ncbi:DUF262 domain-containing protein [Leptospira interrogans]
MKAANISKTQFTVGDFVSWMRNGELDLSPNFQRRPVWKKKAKSYLLDTIVRGLPTPIIFLRQITDTKTLSTVREVVDGQQRIRTLLSFIDKRLIKNWEEQRDQFTVIKSHNPEIAGKTFSELDSDYKQRILDYQFSTHVLPTDTSDQQVLDIFRRMNATGTKLNRQELRNAEYFGEFASSVYAFSLASLDLWRKWRIFTEDNIARMDEVEFVSEIYIMMISGVSEKNQIHIDAAYGTYDDVFSDRKRVEGRLNALLEDLDDAFGHQMAPSPLSNRIVLYPLLAALYKISYAGVPPNKKATKKRVAALAAKLRRLSDRLHEDRRAQLPRAVQDALLSRPGRKANRQALTNFIVERLTA